MEHCRGLHGNGLDLVDVVEGARNAGARNAPFVCRALSWVEQWLKERRALWSAAVRTANAPGKHRVVGDGVQVDRGSLQYHAHETSYFQILPQKTEPLEPSFTSHRKSTPLPWAITAKECARKLVGLKFLNCALETKRMREVG